MELQTGAAAIQRMHEDRTVTRDAVIEWYYLYQRKLPRMQPERSEADLIRTAALWMELTDKGGAPGFPYDYRSDLRLPPVASVTSGRPHLAWRLTLYVALAGVAIAFWRFWVGVVLIVVGGLGQYISYRVAGGPCNIATIGRSGLRVLEWSEKGPA